MVPTNHSGAAAELKAISYLLEKGFDVFRNISPHGPADLVALNPETGETILYDVKSANVTYRRKDGVTTVGVPSLPLKSRRIGVRPIFVCLPLDVIAEDRETFIQLIAQRAAAGGAQR